MREVPINVLNAIDPLPYARVLSTEESEPEYELDASALEPHYNGAEGFWTSHALDWLIYHMRAQLLSAA